MADEVYDGAIGIDLGKAPCALLRCPCEAGDSLDSPAPLGQN
jgi:hypothetical protein